MSCRVVTGRACGAGLLDGCSKPLEIRQLPAERLLIRRRVRRDRPCLLVVKKRPQGLDEPLAEPLNRGRVVDVLAVIPIDKKTTVNDPADDVQQVASQSASAAIESAVNILGSR